MPHLIHIGFPKCASTFLQGWFAAHPQLAYKPGGWGGMYGAYDLIAEVLCDPRLALCRVTSVEDLSVPTDLSGLDDPNAFSGDVRRHRMSRICEELAELFPKAKILMITRNQADMAISGYSQIIKQGGSMGDAAYGRFVIENFRSRDSIDYDLTLQLYREKFGGRILALPYELLVDDRRAFLAQIADFMRVDQFDLAAGRVNESLDAEQLYWYPRISRLLQRAPSNWLRCKLVALHVRMIRLGAWRPLLNLLKIVTGKKGLSRFLSPDILRKFEIDCEELLRLEPYASYRELYRGTVDSTALSTP